MSSKVFKWFIRQASFRRHPEKPDAKERQKGDKSPSTKKRIFLPRLSFRKKKKLTSSPTPHTHTQGDMGALDTSPERVCKTNISGRKENGKEQSPPYDCSRGTISPSKSSNATNTSESYDNVLQSDTNSDNTRLISELSVHSSIEGDFKNADSHLVQDLPLDPTTSPPQDIGLYDNVPTQIPEPSFPSAKVEDTSTYVTVHSNPCYASLELHKSDVVERDDVAEGVHEDRKEQSSIPDKSKSEEFPLDVEQSFDDILKLNNINITSFVCSKNDNNRPCPMESDTKEENAMWLSTEVETRSPDRVSEDCITESSNKNVEIEFIDSDTMSESSEDTCITAEEVFINKDTLSDAVLDKDVRDVTIEPDSMRRDSRTEQTEKAQDPAINEAYPIDQVDLHPVVNDQFAGEQSEDDPDSLEQEIEVRSNPSTTEQITETSSQTSDKSNDITFQSIDSDYPELEEKSVKIIVTEPSPEHQQHVIVSQPIQTKPPTTPVRIAAKKDEYPEELNPFGDDDDESLLNDTTNPFGSEDEEGYEEDLSNHQRYYGIQRKEESSLSNFSTPKDNQNSNPFGEDECDTERFSPTNPFADDCEEPFVGDRPPRLPPKSDIPKRNGTPTAIPVPHPRKTRPRIHGSFTSLQSVPVCPIPAPRTLTPTSSAKNLNASNDDDGYFKRNVYERSSVQALSSSQEDFVRNSYRHGSVPPNGRVRVGRKKRPAPLPPSKNPNEERTTPPKTINFGEPPSTPTSPSGVFYSLPRRTSNKGAKMDRSPTSPSYLCNSRPPPRPPPPKKKLSDSR